MTYGSPRLGTRSLSDPDLTRTLFGVRTDKSHKIRIRLKPEASLACPRSDLVLNDCREVLYELINFLRLGFVQTAAFRLTYDISHLFPTTEGVFHLELFFPHQARIYGLLAGWYSICEQ